MNRVFYSIIPAVFATSLSAASVLTFEDGTYFYGGTNGTSLNYTEGDFLVTGDWVDSGQLHSHTSFSNTISFVDGGRFNADSVDLDPLVSAYRFEDITDSSNVVFCDLLCVDVSITGYRDGEEVAYLATSSAADVNSFGSEFNGIDAIEIEFRSFFNDEAIQDVLDQGYYFAYEDNQIEYDNLTVAAVPIPAAGILLFSALGGMVALRRRKRG